MDNSFFRKLTVEEEQEFCEWARINYKPEDKIKEVWHPIVRKECNKINKERREQE